MSSKLQQHAAQLAALGSTVRLGILRELVQGNPEGTPVGDLQAKLGVPWSTLSHHLERLSAAGIVRQRSEGKFHFYRADFSALRALTSYLWEDCCKGGNKTNNCC